MGELVRQVVWGTEREWPQAPCGKQSWSQAEDNPLNVEARRAVMLAEGIELLVKN